MKRRFIALGAVVLTLASGCKDYLDVNTNPNGPEIVAANLYVAPMLHWLVTAPEYDGRYVGMYTQQWVSTSTNNSPYFTWGRMGYDPGSDNGAEQWRDVYWSFGQGLIDMMQKAEAEERWDILGLGYLLKAWGWMALTDLHGEIIVKEAFDQTRFTFDYDSQDYVYTEILRLLDESIKNLQRTDGRVDAAYMGRGDRIYAGDRTKWLKLAYGVRAMAKNHLSNKASLYKPDDIIADVDLSLASNADDPLLPYTGNDPALNDYNFLGTSRDNVTLFRQTQFAINMLNGTNFGGVVDPRLSRMLAPAPDSQYRGLDPNSNGFNGLPDAQRPNNFFGYPASTRQTPSRYIFDNKSKLPAITTYAVLQFVKAEAAFKKGDKATALAAYRNAIDAHITFVNSRNADAAQSPTQISAAERSAFLADVNVVPTDPAQLTISMIMMQKYIALWGWGHNELWMDMRRYHYTDLDPATGKQVYLGFAAPTTLYADNAGKMVWRIRPRYNSDYVWNKPGLNAIGGLAADYHTKQPWIFQPE
jgi:hypothetical protein